MKQKDEVQFPQSIFVIFGVSYFEQNESVCFGLETVRINTENMERVKQSVNALDAAVTSIESVVQELSVPNTAHYAQ